MADAQVLVTETLPSDALPEGAADDVRALADAADRADGVAPLSEQPLLWLADEAAPVVHVTARDAGALVGYAQLDVRLATTVSGELVVHPEHRRRGVGTTLLRAALAHAGGADAELRVWAHGALPAARALAARERLAPVRELWQMSLDLPSRPPSTAQVPAGVTLRTFVPGQDEDAWRRVNSRAFARHPEQGRMTADDLRAREAEPWFDPEGFLLAERDGHLLASAWTKVHPAGAHGPEPVGELYVLGVDPDAQGLGLGRALTRRALEHLAGRGLTTAILYTSADNTVAVRTYERAGFVRSGVDVMFSSRPPTGTRGADADVTMAP